MSVRARKSASTLSRCARAATPSVIEGLERRVMLSTTPVPITTPLNTGSGEIKAVLQTVAKLDDLANEVVKVDSQLSSVIGKLPLVGDGVKNAIGGANDKFKGVATTIKNALDTLHSATTVTGEDIQTALFTALSAAGILPASITSASQMPVQLFDTDGTAADAEQVELDLELKGTIFTAALNPDFDLGLPGLGLSLDGTVQAQLNYDVHIDIGIDTTNFFYLNLGKDNPELSLSLAITTPGLHAGGTLGFLQLDSTDGTADGNTKLVGTISADLGCSNSNILTASNLASITSDSTLSADAQLDLHLHNVLSFGGSANFPSLEADLDLTWQLGSVSLNSGGVSASSGDAPDVHFHNIKLDLGSFFSKFVSPIVNEVKTILHPLQPLVDLLNTRMPIFSDIGPLTSEFDNNPTDGKVTLLEVIDKLGGGSSKLLDTIVAVSNFVNNIPTGIGSNVTIDLGSFELGGASNVNGADVRSLAGLSSVNLTTFSVADITAEMTSIGTAIGGTTGGQIAGFLGNLATSALGGAGGDDGGGMHFPILDNPSSAFNLLLGKNVDLFTFDTPTLDLHSSLDEFFPILGPLGVELFGTLDSAKDFVQVKAHLSMGYDTAGIVEFANGGFKPADVGELFDGFYLLDDPTKTYASAAFGAEAAAAIDIVVASAGVGGFITGNINFTVNDPGESSPPAFDDGQGKDGRLRPKEIIADLKMSPLCLFDISGKVIAGLNAYIRVGFDTPFGFVGWSDTFDLGTTTLTDFSFGCSSMHDSPPVLATLLGDGTLQLNMGPHAGERLTGDLDDDAENFAVTHVSTQGDGTETVDVQAFGYVQEYSGVKKIYADGGQGDDVITLQSGVISPADLYGGVGNDEIHGADGATTMHGGDGNDNLFAGSGATTMYGEAGDDLLQGGAGADYLDGGDGNDTAYGMGGNDSLFGGAGADYLDGGDANDSLDGGADDDHLIGGDGNDTETGGDGNDVLEGNAGNDSLNGGAGNDLLLGDSGSFVDIVDSFGFHTFKLVIAPGGGNDSMSGGDGSDIMFGEDGNDSMSGDAGNDYMQGNAGNDNMDGGDGNDSMVGGQGADSMTGDAGNDIMLGDDGDISSSGAVTLANSVTDGNDTMGGGADTDLMYAQGGNDSMTGDAGNDSLDGGDGTDSMIGGQGNDSMTGDAGNDIMLGDDGTIVGATVTLNSSFTDGNDTMSGGDGNDAMYGQGGNDSMSGDGGADYMEGDAGNDTMAGGAGNDTMDGGDGQDVMLGQGDNDVMIGDAGDDQMIGGRGNDSMDGGAGNDIMLGDDGTITAGQVSLSNSATDGSDSMTGGDGNDLMFGQGGNDVMSGNNDSDVMVGGQGNDLMDGGAGNDLMLGDDAAIGAGNSVTPVTTAADGNDSMSGGTGDDAMYGQGGDDDMIGNAGNDWMDGGDGQDVMLGDDGTITPASPARLVLETSSALRIALPASLTVGGNDTMAGGNGQDAMYGQGGNDSMSGGGNDDYMEGNAGSDNMSGDAGDDDMIGGSSVANTTDAGDSMSGGDGNDVMLGDNGQITRVVDGSNNYVRYSAANKLGLQDGAVIRNVTLFADQDTVGGNDSMAGGNNDDIMYGEAGDDVMAGDANNDQMYGGLGNDSMDGGTGNDGMVGDKGLINPSIFDGSTQTILVSQAKKISVAIDVGGTINWSVTLIDSTNGGNDSMKGGLGNDAMHGGAGADLMYGDDTASNTVGGNDLMFGDDGNDNIFGQAGNDHIYGGSGDDYLDGGLGNDIIYGGDGQDSLFADNKDDFLIDWFGNFNSFNVPGPGFGSPTIIRSPDPLMQQFLLNLGAADGATNPQLELVVVTPPSPANSGPGTGGSH
jgi:Ca2+-binding RTX toxin-like protein